MWCAVYVGCIYNDARSIRKPRRGCQIIYADNIKSKRIIRIWVGRLDLLDGLPYCSIIVDEYWTTRAKCIAKDDRPEGVF